MFLGIEIGGTKLQLGVGGGRQAGLDAVERRRIIPSDGAHGILQQITEAARHLLQRFPIGRVGIGFGGPVDTNSGRVITSHQIDGWTGFDMADWVREQFDLPAMLGNDCDCAALAEARYGAGRGHSTVFYVTVGTGVGGGLVIDGGIHGINRPSAAEIGHLRPGLFADDAQLTVESLASGWGITNTARACLEGHLERLQDRLLHGGRPRLSESDRYDLMARCLGDPQSLTVVMIGQAANDGNEGAKAVLGSATDVLGWAIAQVMTIVCPDIVVIGGGVSLLGNDLFFYPLGQAIRRYLFPPLNDNWQLTAAELGEEVVVHGAVALAASERQDVGQSSEHL